MRWPDSACSRVIASPPWAGTATGISGVGMVMHTINPRLFTDQLTYIVNHAADRLLFVDLTFVPLVEKVIAALPTIEHVVIMTDRAHMPQETQGTTLPKVLCYEDL